MVASRMRRRLWLLPLTALLFAAACAARTTPERPSLVPRPVDASPAAVQEPVGAPSPEGGRLRQYLATNRGRLLGLGVGLRVSSTPGDEVGNALDPALLVRLGAGSGWGPAIGFGWSTRELVATETGGTPLADLRMRPLMVGAAYGRPVGRTQVTGSLVGGYAFTRLKGIHVAPGVPRATEVEGAFAWRPSVSVWVATTDRLALQVSAGYLVARPRVTIATGDRFSATQTETDGRQANAPSTSVARGTPGAT
jgi:hypothetical protein